jgi:hypothetical protein
LLTGDQQLAEDLVQELDVPAVLLRPGGHVAWAGEDQPISSGTCPPGSAPAPAEPAVWTTICIPSIILGMTLSMTTS